ncbi:MAG: hypothetical protein UY19_C0007G0013 [Candidatus Wolfebacteria bacterium GW2011_GWA2_47_9b]|uniref:Uncharacterized protein n=1 Tax=Candidatus Wolfebacteria bacterium GW2011_GWA2_47_9b TaxID=1619005 RepID=A0A0G1U748_9BACT|nr:MAG: hypothetical protein UY19_C0007G0013 [Candidatus Wolfebacteria bacterium GW2011_GWA2_47_9b]
MWMLLVCEEMIQNIIYARSARIGKWIPAFAGMTDI